MSKTTVPWRVRIGTALVSLALGMSAFHLSGPEAAVWCLLGILWGILFTFMRLASEK